MGNIPRREVFLAAMRDLPKAVMAGDDEALRFISVCALFGPGVGYVITYWPRSTHEGTTLWTRDRRLQ